jgi:hypothetical protein
MDIPMKFQWVKKCEAGYIWMIFPNSWDDDPI